MDFFLRKCTFLFLKLQYIAVIDTLSQGCVMKGE